MIRRVTDKKAGSDKRPSSAARPAPTPAAGWSGMSSSRSGGSRGPGSLRAPLAAAFSRRAHLLRAADTTVCRLFSGKSDGIDGMYIDRLGPGIVIALYEGRVPDGINHEQLAADALRAATDLVPDCVRAVYVKPFAKDRSRLGGEAPPITRDPLPLAGDELPESVVVREHGVALEVRHYDGFSCGVFLDQRRNRRELSAMCKRRIKAAGSCNVLNTFCYTGAFSVACAAVGASTTSVDVSAKYLDWAKRNFAHNAIAIDNADASRPHHRFARLDTFDFLGLAQKKGHRYDLIILDPPSFGSGDKKRKIKPWSSVEHYPALVAEAAKVLAPGGRIFASTNTTELCRVTSSRGGPAMPRLWREIIKGLGEEPKWLEGVGLPEDASGETDRFACALFELP
ncbi:MAG: class I SAM-dependent methyltransferase [Planctomycetota bacterium]|nr:class I SAM-dependent methyltransferase [Planctomycetota bacterium]